MAECILVTSLLAVFLLRDSQLLAIKGSWPLRVRLTLYIFAKFLFVAGFLLVFPECVRGNLVATLRSPMVWPSAIVVHLIGWLACAYTLRKPGENAWSIALLPSPILLVSLIWAAKWFATQPDGIIVPAVIAVCWVGVVSTLTFIMNRPWRDEQESRFIVEFAGLSNLTVLAALPVVLSAA